MNPNGAIVIPRGQRNGKHWPRGIQIRRRQRDVARDHRCDRSRPKASRRSYDFAVARDYDAVSQIEAMDREGLD